MLKKDITFIYMDSAEKSAYEPILAEAQKRGYKARLSKDKFAKCEIGVYCQHNNFPQYSKFSVIMLHDIIQQYGNWPDLWFREPWDKYDVGIIPSEQWEKNWNQCSQWGYTRPRRGMYKIGWPKADAVLELQRNTYKDDFFKKYGLDERKKTILYAPAWENDGKQNDFVNAMKDIGVNILIKQADWDPMLYPEQVKNVQEMYEKHKNLAGVTILPASTNIFSAIAVSDVLVSEESSTMCEAAMMGIPAVSVSDWLIPDVSPSRFPKCDYDFVVTTTREKLAECVKEIVEKYEVYHENSIEFAKANFLNIGNTSSMIMDIIDDCVEGKRIRYKALIPKKKERVPFKKEIKRRGHLFWVAMVYHYNIKYPLLGKLWKRASRIKHYFTK